MTERTDRRLRGFSTALLFPVVLAHALLSACAYELVLFTREQWRSWWSANMSR